MMLVRGMHLPVILGNCSLAACLCAIRSAGSLYGGVRRVGLTLRYTRFLTVSPGIVGRTIFMALPWGDAGTSSPRLPEGELEISISRWAARRSFFSSPSRMPVDSAGCFTAPPGAAYTIDVTLHQRFPKNAQRVVRASIDGREINEQIVLFGGSSGKAHFVGWLEDSTGAKRIQFTFPPSGESTVTVGVFEATESGSKSGRGAGKVHQAPQTASGASFAGPTVGDGTFVLGEPVAAGLVRLRAQA